MNGRRLAYVCADRGIAPDGTKGASVHFREMGRALVRSGVEVTACVQRAPAADFSEFPVVPVRRGNREEAKRGVAAELEQLIDQGPMLEALAGLGPIDAIYERYSLFGLAGLQQASQRGVPFLLEVNAPLWEEAQRFRGLTLHGLALSVALELFSNATAVLVVSEGLRRRLLALGVDPARVVVFPNGVGPHFWSNPSPMTRPPALVGKRVLLFVGSLKPWHGVGFLLRAFTELRRQRPDLGLWVVGDGPEREAVAQAVADHPNAVVHTPAVRHEDIPALLGAADVAVAPYDHSSPEYFCPLKAIEALAAGVPLLASDVPAIRDIPPGGFHIHTFEADSISDFGRALDAALDHTLARPRALRNLEIARESLTWDARSRDVSELLRWGMRAPVIAALGGGSR